MPELKGQLVVRGTAPFGRAAVNPIRRRVQEFQQAELLARTQAANTATKVTRDSFRYLRNPVETGRASRESTGGRFAQHLRWSASRRGVEFDVPHADESAPHWIIMEIGTGRRAKMRYGGDEQEGSGARPAQLRTVKSQRGRLIHGSLVFADRPGGAYTPPGVTRTQQLFFRNQVTGAPRRREGIRIKREIKGQHFVKKGAQAGFRQYKGDLLTAARKSFRKGTP